LSRNKLEAIDARADRGNQPKQPKISTSVWSGSRWMQRASDRFFMAPSITQKSSWRDRSRMVHACGASLRIILFYVRVAGLREFLVTENGATNGVSLGRFEAPIITSDVAVFPSVTTDGRATERPGCLSHSEI
jgi:hypothetical protein